MASSRRHFLRQATGGILGAWSIAALTSAAEANATYGADRAVAGDDEQFWRSVRDQFPLTRERIYFNNGTIGPSPMPVIEALRKSLDAIDATGEYGGWEVARPKIASFLNVKEEEISLTHNVTEGINIIAHGLPLTKGDEVIITTHEHVGNALPWINRMTLDGIVLKPFTPAPTAAETLDRVKALLSPRTRAIAVPHITCTTGQVLPVKEIAAFGRSKGLWIFFDGAHGPGTTELDLRDLDCDFYASCGHKWLCGPKGTGFLYVRKELLDTVQARWVGGYSDLGWDLTTPTVEFKGYVPTAHRYDFGTQNAALSVGLAAAVDFINHIGLKNIINRSRSLAAQLQQELLSLGSKIEMLTPVEEASRGTIVAFRLPSMPYDKLGDHLARKGFRIRRVPESHLNAIRVSTHLYNSSDEVMKFVSAVREVA